MALGRLVVAGDAGLFVRIVVLFLVAGPPVGAVAFSLLGGAGAWATGQPGGTAGLVFYGGLLAVVVSWAVGGIQAAATGILVALSAVKRRRYSPTIAAVAGLAIGLAYHVIHLADEAPGFGLAALMVAVHGVSAVVCNAIAGRLFPLDGRARSLRGA